MSTNRPGLPPPGISPRLIITLLFFAALSTLAPGDARAQLPWLDHVQIGPGAPCDGCPARVCPGDSIDVFLSGSFPNWCRQLLGVSVLPNPVATPLPQPPIVRITYGSRADCGVCGQTVAPWSAHVRLPAQPPQGGLTQFVPVEAEELDLCSPDSAATFLGRIGAPFYVAADCSTAEACANPGWHDQPRWGQCDG